MSMGHIVPFPVSMIGFLFLCSILRVCMCVNYYKKSFNGGAWLIWSQYKCHTSLSVVSMTTGIQDNTCWETCVRKSKHWILFSPEWCCPSESIGDSLKIGTLPKALKPNRIFYVYIWSKTRYKSHFKVEECQNIKLPIRQTPA